MRVGIIRQSDFGPGRMKKQPFEMSPENRYSPFRELKRVISWPETALVGPSSRELCKCPFLHIEIGFDIAMCCVEALMPEPERHHVSVCVAFPEMVAGSHGAVSGRLDVGTMYRRPVLRTGA
jgi:hypothetical protein